MKIIKPDYYRQFKCIAGECTDTCCAGWDVDVDSDSYEYYKKVGGAIGNKLEKVMRPKKDEEGCTFELTSDMRCPFLDERNLCELIINLGEDSICETCTDFPRFKNEYGATREIGIAPSCPVVADMFVSNGPGKLEEEITDEMVSSFNDIDPEWYMEVRAFRDRAFKVINDKSLGGVKERLKIIYKDAYELEHGEPFNGTKSLLDEAVDVRKLTEPFEGYEVINKDWYREIGVLDKYYEEERNKITLSKDVYDLLGDSSYAFENLIFYYLFRFVMDSVYDDNLLINVKKAVVACVICEEICNAHISLEGDITKEQVSDIFHLYSRQFEHSYVNYEYRTEQFASSEIYSDDTIMKLLR